VLFAELTCLLLPLQTLMYTAITYPMLQLEWTAAKVFWYLLMQVKPVDMRILLSTFLCPASCCIIAPRLALGFRVSRVFCSGQETFTEDKRVCVLQFTCLQYMTNFGALTIAITPNEQAGTRLLAACLAVCLAMKVAE
jgi:hypothetical protein